MRATTRALSLMWDNCPLTRNAFRTRVISTRKMRETLRAFGDVRWMLGRMLRKVMRGKRPPGTGRGHKGEKSKEQAGPYFSDELKRLNLAKPRAIEAQRIGTLPEASCLTPTTRRTV